MPFLENVAKVHCGVSVKDRWINGYSLVKKTKRQVIEGTVKEILTIDGMSKVRLSLLNSYMRELLREKVLVGVSQKAIAKTKKLQHQSLMLVERVCQLRLML